MLTPQKYINEKLLVVYMKRGFVILLILALVLVGCASETVVEEIATQSEPAQLGIPETPTPVEVETEPAAEPAPEPVPLQPTDEFIYITTSQTFDRDHFVVARGSTITIVNQDKFHHEVSMTIKGSKVFTDKFIPNGRQHTSTLEFAGTYYIESIREPSLEARIVVK